VRKHGSRACYVFGPEPGGDRSNGCRCDDCRRAVREYERERTRRIAPAYVGAAPARAHVRFLSEHGVGLKQIVKRSGVSQGALWKLMYGKDGKPSKRIRRETSERILAVQPADRADGSRVPAGPVWEQVDTLLERGWTRAAIARGIGQERALQLGREWVTAANARAVAALLDQPVPPRRSRHGLHPVPQPEVEDDEPTLPDDLPAPPAVDLTAMPWRREAACRMPDVPVWIFFPGRGDHRTAAAAKAVCDRCAARAACLETHLDERDGIFGGTTGRERRALRRERGLDDDQADDESEVA
jgi:transcriptional regulator with XRE-family HTH domain